MRSLLTALVVIAFASGAFVEARTCEAARQAELPPRLATVAPTAFPSETMPATGLGRVADSGEFGKTLPGLIIGLPGWLLALLVFLWNKKQSRQVVLSGLLKKLVTTLQHFDHAIKLRRTTLQLLESFPDKSHAVEAGRRVQQVNRDYGEVIRLASGCCKEFEAEVASCGFRLPRRISDLLMKLRADLFQLGHHINDGQLDVADVLKASCIDCGGRISRIARGWAGMRLSQFFRPAAVEARIEENEAEQDRYGISPDRMQLVLSLLNKRCTTQAMNGFAVHPPAIVLDDPAVLSRDTVIEELKDSGFKLVLQDGTMEVLSLPELAVLTYQQIFVALQMRDLEEKLQKGGFDRTRVHLETTFSVDDIMQVNMVKVLLSKIEFSPPACEVVRSNNKAESK